MVSVRVMMSGRGGGIDKICSGLGPAHGSSSTVVSTSSFFRSVKCAKPPPFFGLRVSYFSRITAPRAAADPPVSHGSTAAAAILK